MQTGEDKIREVTIIFPDNDVTIREVMDFLSDPFLKEKKWTVVMNPMTPHEARDAEFRERLAPTKGTFVGTHEPNQTAVGVRAV